MRGGEVDLSSRSPKVSCTAKLFKIWLKSPNMLPDSADVQSYATAQSQCPNEDIRHNAILENIPEE